MNADAARFTGGFDGGILQTSECTTQSTFTADRAPRKRAIPAADSAQMRPQVEKSVAELMARAVNPPIPRNSSCSVSPGTGVLPNAPRAVMRKKV